MLLALQLIPSSAVFELSGVGEAWAGQIRAWSVCAQIVCNSWESHTTWGGVDVAP